MNNKVYIHEYIDIILQGRPAYMNHMTKGWGSKGRDPKRNMLMVGVWGTLGSTARWPEVINLWEHDGWHGIAKGFKHETGNPLMQDPELKIWWDEAQKYRSGGFDRILVPAPYSPMVAQIEKDKDIVGSEVFYHERISVRPGKAKEYLAMMEYEWLPWAKSIGLHLVGAYRTAMRNDSEVICIWAMRDWETWAEVEIAYESDAIVKAWRTRTEGIAIDWLNHLMVSAPLSPTRTGVQP